MAVSDRRRLCWRLIAVFVIFFASWRLFFREEVKIQEGGNEFVEHLVDIQHTDSRVNKISQADKADARIEEIHVNPHAHVDSQHYNMKDDRHIHMDLAGSDFAVNMPGGFEILRMVNGEWHTDPTVCETKERFPVAKLHTPTGDIKMSLYSTTDDDVVSSKIRQKGAWELDIVTTIYDIFRKHPDWVFIDIGAHLGVYTLSLAKAGYDVIAVEPLVPNIQRMYQSLELGEYKGIVRVIHNAVSDSNGNLAIRNDQGRKFTEESIMLDELAELFLLKSVVVRIDTGKHQAKVLKGASQFFRHVKVRYLLMDIPKNVQNTEEGKGVIKFLTEQNMKPAMPSNPKVFFNAAGNIDWPTTVLWVKT